MVFMYFQVGFVAEGEETGTPFSEVALTEGVGNSDVFECSLEFRKYML